MKASRCPRCNGRVTVPKETYERTYPDQALVLVFECRKSKCVKQSADLHKGKRVRWTVVKEATS